MASSVHTMRSGETMGLSHPDEKRQAGVPAYKVDVTYRAKPSRGPLSQGGTYTLAYPNGRVETLDHDPLSGASPRSVVASEVSRRVGAHLSARQAGFNDRRR